MKKVHLILILAVLSFLSFSFVKAGDHDDRTLSPYFVVKGSGGKSDVMPLKSTKGDVNIAGVIADVTVTQVYKNEGTKPLEATYVFPASTRAAVYGMQMVIGNRTVTAEIREKAQARQEYEEAKEEGKRVSLLEQERPNVFQMHLANIQPGEEVKVILQYTEMLMPEGGKYEFAYPTVVGPRYSGSSVSEATGEERFVPTPYQRKGIAAGYKFDLQVHLAAGMPIRNVNCGSHKVDIKYANTSTAMINLSDEERAGGNRDFILNYQLRGNEVESGLLLYDHGDEKFFMMMVQPPKRVEPKKIPPREYIFIVDVSGSMRGFPIDVSKKLLRDLVLGLRPTDKFNVLLFAGTSGLLSEESLSATEANLAKAVAFIDGQQGGGGTELLPAMQRALSLPRIEGISRSMVVVTDGYVTVEKEAFDLIRTKRDKANLFAFGIGSSVNRYLVEGMARVGMGEPLIVTNETEASNQADNFRKYIESPVLTNVKVNFNGFDAYDVEPLSVPDVLAERPVVIFGKYKGAAKGTITLKGRSGSGRYKKSFTVGDHQPDTKNRALRYLWARKRIELLDDYRMVSASGDLSGAVTDLGLKYNLLTQYTSFIAVDKQIVNNKELVSVRQPLPLPQGVEESAVGFDLAIEGVVRNHATNKLAMLSVAMKMGEVKLNVPLESYEVLKHVAKEDIEELAGCYESSMLKKGKKVKLIVKLTLDKDGNVLKASIKENDEDQVIAACLAEKIVRWQLSGIQLAEETTFELPLTISK